MKKFFASAALVLGAMSAAHAQVYFDSGSDRPKNPQAAQAAIQKHQRVHAPARPHERVVRCRDGARRLARLCRSHGGVARR